MKIHPSVEIFTFHDHFFRILRDVDANDSLSVQDEYGTTVGLKDASLTSVREACESILAGYREQMRLGESAT
jgi:hypothetical protein